MSTNRGANVRSGRAPIACARVAIGVTALLLFGCSPSPDEPSVPGDWFHAHLTGAEPEQIPFFLFVPEDCSVDTAIIVNGEERNAVPCRRDAGGFAIEFPVYGTGIQATVASDGTLAGSWYRDRPTGRTDIMAFAARPIDEPDPRVRFPVDATAPVDAAAADAGGVWRFDFDIYGAGKGVFEQRPSGVVTGTIEIPADYGDLRFLAGNVIGERLLLSTFDGQQASYVEGNVAGDAMEGVWIFSPYWDEFGAERVDDFELDDPLSRVRYTRGDEPFDLPALRDPKYDGKPVIVQIFATWCPNCSDHAPVLAELFRAHRSEGLEILGLAFEASDDPAYSAARIEEFRKLHDVEWDIVIADTRLEDHAFDGLAGLSPFDGVPVTVFVNRDRTVHAVYTGFAGPAAAVAHERAVARFRRLAEEIVAGG